jgi:hypothetical protein
MASYPDLLYARQEHNSRGFGDGNIKFFGEIGGALLLHYVQFNCILVFRNYSNLVEIYLYSLLFQNLFSAMQKR